MIDRGIFRGAIAAAAAGLALQLGVTALWPVVQGAVRQPSMWLRPGNAMTIATSLASPVCIVLFLILLYREVGGRGGSGPRQAAALVGAAATMIQAAAYAANWLHTRSMLADLRRGGVRVRGRSDPDLLPILYLLALALWVGLLVEFFRSPEVSSRWTRRLAPCLALAAGVLGIRGAIAGLEGSRWIMTVVLLAGTVPLVTLLLLMSRPPREL